MRRHSPVQDDGCVLAGIRGTGFLAPPPELAEEQKRKRVARATKWRLVQHLRDAMSDEELDAEGRRLAEEVQAIISARAETQRETRRAA